MLAFEVEDVMGRIISELTSLYTTRPTKVPDEPGILRICKTSGRDYKLIIDTMVDRDKEFVKMGLKNKRGISIVFSEGS